MDITKLIDTLLDSSTVEELSKKNNLDPKQVTQVASMGIPALLGKLNQNANNDKQKASLAKAIDDHSDDDVSDVLGFLKNIDLNDSQKMLGHIMGDDSQNVSSLISKKSGVKNTDVTSMLAMLAPLIMGFLGNKKKESTQSKSNDFDLGSLIGGLTQQAKQSDKTESSILDMLGDSKGIMDLIGGFFNKK
ncbi:MAG: DUF937 domain-containing protein [Erysipelothrix sp.]|nr:DUF937 domain-containing protein [Erysipelothrix sp.]